MLRASRDIEPSACHTRSTRPTTEREWNASSANVGEMRWHFHNGNTLAGLASQSTHMHSETVPAFSPTPSRMNNAFS